MLKRGERSGSSSSEILHCNWSPMYNKTPGTIGQH